MANLYLFSRKDSTRTEDISYTPEQLTGDLYQDLHDLSAYIVHSMAEQSDIMRLVMFESHQIPELRDMLDFIPQQIMVLLTDYFTRQTLAGKLRSDLHPTLIAQTFFGFFAAFGVGLRMRQEKHLEMPISVEAAQAQLLEVFLHGVTPDDSAQPPSRRTARQRRLLRGGQAR